MSAAVRAGFARLQVRWLLLCGQVERAQGCVHALLHVQPDNPYALATCAHLQAKQGDAAGALQNLRRLVALQPGLAPGWFNLGYLLEAMGQLPEAEAAFRRAIERDPQLDRAWYGLGLSLIGQRRFDDAVVALQRTTELQPMSPHGWYQLARVHVDRHEPEQALKIIRYLRGFEPRVAAQLQRETGLGVA